MLSSFVNAIKTKAHKIFVLHAHHKSDLCRVVVIAKKEKEMQTAVSDLFFNTDVSDAFDTETGLWTIPLLESYADEFLGYLEDLGVKGLPDTEDLVEDFLGRL